MHFQKVPIPQWSKVLMQGHCNENDCYGYISENLLSIQKSFFKLTAIPQAWYKTIFKSVFKKMVLLDKVRVRS